jgi:dipeptidyl aminopeptidase/acylaminoacyl peptidase
LSPKNIPLVTQAINQIIPTPTPFPFQELTINHLRQRSYQSQLGELRRFQETSTYTSYFTSYQSDGNTVNGLLTLPKGDIPTHGWPAVVFVHGYIPPKQYQTTSNYASYVAAFAQKGLIVFKIDLRGHGQSTGDAGGAYYSTDYVIDTLNAVSALKKHSAVDPERISLWGHSMAGNIVFRSFITNPEIKKIVIWAGAGYTYTDLQEYRIMDASYRPPASDSPVQRKRQALFETYGPFDFQSSFWQQIVPTNYLSGVNGAVQIHHAVDDNVVSISYSRNLLKILDSTSINHSLYEYPSGGHNLTGASFTQAVNRTVNFLTQP